MYAQELIGGSNAGHTLVVCGTMSRPLSGTLPLGGRGVDGKVSECPVEMVLYEKFAKAAELGAFGVVCPALSLVPVLLPDASSSSSTEVTAVATMGRLADIFAVCREGVICLLWWDGEGRGHLIPQDVHVAHRFLRTAMKCRAFDAQSVPVVLLWLGSHPERALPLVESIVSS